MSNTQELFDHIFKHLEVRQKYSAARRIFNSLLVLSCLLSSSKSTEQSKRTKFSIHFEARCPNLSNLKLLSPCAKERDIDYFIRLLGIRSTWDASDSSSLLSVALATTEVTRISPCRSSTLTFDECLIISSLN